MGFDSLWAKYGEQIKHEEEASPSIPDPQSLTIESDVQMGVETQKEDQIPLPGQSARQLSGIFGEQNSGDESTGSTADASGQRKNPFEDLQNTSNERGLTGVVGEEESPHTADGGEISPAPRGRLSGRSRFFWNITHDSIPWVDVVGILITAGMVIWVILNFESVTDRLFMVLLGLISNLFSLLIILGIIIAFFLWLTRRHRPWF